MGDGNGKGGGVIVGDGIGDGMGLNWANGAGTKATAAIASASVADIASRQACPMAITP